MPPITRNIIITANNLGSSPTLLFTFDKQDMEVIYQIFFPVVFKSFDIPSEGTHSVMITFSDELAFTNPKVENNKIISSDSEAWIGIKPWQQTDLITEAGSNKFTPPTDIAEDIIGATNKTDAIQRIGIGFDIGSDKTPNTAVVFSPIGSMGNVGAQFNQTLNIYVCDAYAENEVITGQIQTPPIWSRDVTDLTLPVRWDLRYDPTHQLYSITPEGQED